MASSLRNTHAKLTALSKELQQTLPPSAAPSKTGFSDEHVFLIAKTVKIQDQAEISRDTAPILNRFWSLYIQGIVPDTDNLPRILFDAVCLLNVDGTMVFKDRGESDAKFPCPANTSKEWGILAATSTVSTSDWLRCLPDKKKQKYAELLESYTEGSAASFASTIQRLIKQVQSTEDLKESHWRFCNLTAYLSLILMRSCIQNNTQLSGAFLKKQLRTNITQLIGEIPGVNFAPPCKEAISKCTTAFVKGSTVVSLIFSVIVARYIDASKQETRQATILGLLFASVLTDTARYGMGMLSLMDQACLALKCNIPTLFNASLFNFTEVSWREIFAFMSRYTKLGSEEKGYNWARIIDDAYFKNLSPRSHKFLACIFTAIVETTQDEGVWNAMWLEGKAERYTAAIQIGRAKIRENKDSGNPGGF